MTDILQDQTMSRLIAEVLGVSEGSVGPGKAETAGCQQNQVMNGLISKIFGVNEAPALGDLQVSGAESGEMAPGPAETKHQGE